MSEFPNPSPDQLVWSATPETSAPPRTIEEAVEGEVESQRAATTVLKGTDSILLGPGALVDDRKLDGILGDASGVDLVAKIANTEQPNAPSYIFRSRTEQGTALLVVPEANVEYGVANRGSIVKMQTYLEQASTKIEGDDPLKGANFCADGTPYSKHGKPAKAFTVSFDAAQGETSIRHRGGRIYSTEVTYSRQAQMRG